MPKKTSLKSEHLQIIDFLMARAIETVALRYMGKRPFLPVVTFCGHSVEKACGAIPRKNIGVAGTSFSVL